MKARRAYRDRRAVEVAVLDALIDRREEGMTVLELRAAVDADIDTIEAALADLKGDDLIVVSRTRDATVLKPDPRVVPDAAEPADEPSLVDRLRDRLPF